MTLIRKKAKPTTETRITLIGENLTAKGREATHGNAMTSSRGSMQSFDGLNDHSIDFTRSSFAEIGTVNDGRETTLNKKFNVRARKVVLLAPEADERE
jgi:hypothetical protein